MKHPIACILAAALLAVSTFTHAQAWPAHPIRRSRPQGCDPTHQDGDQHGTERVDHARSLPEDHRCEYGASAGFTLGHPSTESAQPIDGTVAYISSPNDSSSTSVGLAYSPTATDGAFAIWGAGARAFTSQNIKA